MQYLFRIGEMLIPVDISIKEQRDVLNISENKDEVFFMESDEYPIKITEVWKFDEGVNPMAIECFTPVSVERFIDDILGFKIDE